MSDELSKKLTKQERLDYEAGKKQVRAGDKDIERGMLAVAGALADMHERKLYREDYDTFDDFCQQEFGWTRQWGHRVLKANGVWQNLLTDENVKSTLHSETRLPSIDAAASLAQLPPKEQGEAYQEAQREAATKGKEAPSTKQVKASVQKRKSAAGTPLQAPKPSMKAPDGSQFGKFLGQAVRFLDTYCEHHNVQNGERHKRILKRLNGADEAFAELRGIVER